MLYTKKPVTIEAKQWTGENIQELWDWVGADKLYGALPVGDDLAPEGRPAKLYVAANDAWLDLEVGEWIIKDQLGFYPCKNSVFELSYEPAVEPVDPTELTTGALLAYMGTDATKWANQFGKMRDALMARNGDPHVVIDTRPGSWIHGWFGNAIEAGISQGQNDRNGVLAKVRAIHREHRGCFTLEALGGGGSVDNSNGQYVPGGHPATYYPEKD